MSTKAELFPGESILKFIHQSQHRKLFSLRNKRFQSSYCAKVRAEAKKKVEGGGGGEKRKCLPANPTILKNAP